MKDTLKCLLQYLIVVLLLTVRLHTLPILYLLRRLTISRARANVTTQVRDLTVDPTSHLLAIDTRNQAVTTSFNPFRLAQNLGKLLLTLGRSSIILFDPRERRSSIESGGSAHAANGSSGLDQRRSSVTATASQVYHAALVGSKTLDNLLNTFGSPLVVATPTRQALVDFDEEVEQKAASTSQAPSPSAPTRSQHGEAVVDDIKREQTKACNLQHLASAIPRPCSSLTDKYAQPADCLVKDDNVFTPNPNGCVEEVIHHNHQLTEANKGHPHVEAAVFRPCRSRRHLKTIAEAMKEDTPPLKGQLSSSGELKDQTRNKLQRRVRS